MCKEYILLDQSCSYQEPGEAPQRTSIPLPAGQAQRPTIPAIRQRISDHTRRSIQTISVSVIAHADTAETVLAVALCEMLHATKELPAMRNRDEPVSLLDCLDGQLDDNQVIGDISF
jgi:hypothetical protein